MSDPMKPEPGSPFPNGSSVPPPTGSPFPSGPPPGQQPTGHAPYQQAPYAPLPADMNVRKSQGWGWNPFIGITYNGFPVGIVIVAIVGLLVLAGK